ncbi:MAG: hypothetical protein CL566_00805 [Alphaproteobacteria bacterium]|nr:hypothetical protein [Alphaproteobacteria bacterium]
MQRSRYNIITVWLRSDGSEQRHHLRHRRRDHQLACPFDHDRPNLLLESHPVRVHVHRVVSTGAVVMTVEEPVVIDLMQGPHHHREAADPVGLERGHRRDAMALDKLPILVERAGREAGYLLFHHDVTQFGRIGQRRVVRGPVGTDGEVRG